MLRVSVFIHEMLPRHTCCHHGYGLSVYLVIWSDLLVDLRGTNTCPSHRTHPSTPSPHTTTSVRRGIANCHQKGFAAYRKAKKPHPKTNNAVDGSLSRLVSWLTEACKKCRWRRTHMHQEEFHPEMAFCMVCPQAAPSEKKCHKEMCLSTVKEIYEPFIFFAEERPTAATFDYYIW